jgi:enterochelin esterase-like enzyme
MKRFLIIGLLLLAACEPLAPDVEQAVIVITNTPEASPAVSETPLFGNTIPERPTETPTRAVTLTPTVQIIPTATLPPCDESEGAFFESSYASSIAGEDVPYNVYLPPCFFASGRRYPLLILLHGSGYEYTQWDDLGIQEVINNGLGEDDGIAPMVVLMPEGGTIQETNGFDVGASYEDMLLDELLPDIERSYCILPQGNGRAIGGISRGGFWAFSIALRHPDQFAAVGGHSPWFVPDNAPVTHNPLALSESAPGIEGLNIYLDNAQSDSGGANVIVLSNALRNRGVVHSYVINAVGDHSNEYWSAHLPEYLAFYSQTFPKDPAELPSCQ